MWRTKTVCRLHVIGSGPPRPANSTGDSVGQCPFLALRPKIAPIWTGQGRMMG